MTRAKAFTLVETLLVMGVVAVLAALILSASRNIRANADRATAVSQMRQIGLGVLSFTADHDGYLPGAMKPPQGTMYVPGITDQLSSTLGPYLEVADLEKTSLIKIFVPPAGRKAIAPASPETARFYVLNISASADGFQFRPWGSLAGTISGPMKIQALPARTWGLCDADRQNPHVTGQPWADSTPDRIIHGRERLAWYFDGAVETLAANSLQAPGGGGGGGGNPPPPPPPPPPRK